MEKIVFRTSDFTASYYNGKEVALKNINLEIEKNSIVSFLGTHGCGKSTLLRCFNKMHFDKPQNSSKGSIFFEGISLECIDTSKLRRRVALISENSVIIKKMTIYENILAGFLLNKIKIRPVDGDRIVEEVLKKVNIWNEVKERLFEKVYSISESERVFLSLARAMALEPEVIMLDEPTQKLDSETISRFEELLEVLKLKHTLIISTINATQAARISDFTFFFHKGELIESGLTKKIFTNPTSPKTEKYITGNIWSLNND